MWRLKIADGGNDPYIFSTNNFVGRQIWEYDPEAGTPEERAQVEAARQDFYNNRFKFKPCGDLLWRFQVPSYYYLTTSITIANLILRSHLTSCFSFAFSFFLSLCPFPTSYYSLAYLLFGKADQCEHFTFLSGYQIKSSICRVQ